VLSFWLGFGLHPGGARLIQEHYVLYPPQETYSYYGPLTYVSLHVGYHNEHHDFPSTSWNNLPKIKKAASEYYDSLHSHTSWTKLLFRFIFDKKISLFDRVTRHERGKIQLNAPVRPDLDLMSQS
ncbi:MAG: fatty acid desaturase, partial [Leptospiraceae bacterium]|nr:fatty acid desaturase [Leptospiraceae bacterium]